jgi:hypothetical protein
VGPATVAKNLRDLGVAKPSPFVELLWTVMTSAVPKELQEHTASKNAMASATSRVLIRSKSGKKRPTGRFYQILHEINPVRDT